MVDLFAHAPATRQSVSVARLQVLLQACEEDALTGIVDIRQGADKQFVLLFVEGLIWDAYAWLAAACEKATLSQILTVLPTGEILDARTLSLPLEGVRVVKVLLEWHPPVENVTAESALMENRLKAWSGIPRTGVVHVTWPDAEGFVILPGGVPPNNGIFVAGGEIKSEATGLAAIHTYQGGTCILTRYEARADSVTAQKQVAGVRAAFSLLVNAVLARYTELLGSSLASALMFDLSDIARVNGWRIKITTNGVSDTHTFDTLDAAAHAYGLLAAEMVKHMTVVIGANLVAVILSREIGNLSLQAQQTLQLYRMVPETALAGASKR